jgi:UDP-2-acetamido-3-amino-2,3-dideoxy-glucuronate N-acetyltransferase
MANEVHPTAIVDAGAWLGDRIRIWHWVHVRAGAEIGDDTSIGQGCYIGAVAIGRGCRIQNQVSLFDGVTLEDEVFLGPSCVFTNVVHPRAHVSRKHAYQATRIGRGATVGANATILSGVTIGAYAMIGAGAVLTHDAPPYGLMIGTPARRVGWACQCGETLAPSSGGNLRCPGCAESYRLDEATAGLLAVTSTR